MEPKFKQSYDVMVEKKKIHHRGEAVGIIGGSTGTVHKAIWNESYHRWTYTLYPNYMDGAVTIFEDQLLPIKEWLAFGYETMQVLGYLTTIPESRRRLSPIAMNILSQYKALLSGRLANPRRVIDHLMVLIEQIRVSFEIYDKDK
jgi:hypothetical protein